MIYNIRHARNLTQAIVNRIQEENQLSQGWGGGGEVNLDLRNDGFIENTRIYHELATNRIPSNLTRMRAFHDGDVLVTPHLPEYGRVSIHFVKGNFPECYSYVPDDSSHQNHRISLQKSVGLYREISIKNLMLLPWYTQLGALRLPVLPISDFAGIFFNIVHAMDADPARKYPTSELDEFFTDLKVRVVSIVAARLGEIPPAGRNRISFESVCERLLLSAGYEIVGGNLYDGQGGDVDLICRRPRRDMSVFEGGDVTLYVQVKRHEGQTSEEAVQQVINMIQANPQADGCVMSLADDYTLEAKILAEGNGIVLLNQDEICSLILQNFSANFFG